MRIRVRNTAICGTDMHIYKWDAWAQKTIPVPMVVGHEYCGEIIEIGAEVSGFSLGDRVSAKGISLAATVATVAPAVDICVATPSASA